MQKKTNHKRFVFLILIENYSKQKCNSTSKTKCNHKPFDDFVFQYFLGKLLLKLSNITVKIFCSCLFLVDCFSSENLKSFFQFFLKISEIFIDLPTTPKQRQQKKNGKHKISETCPNINQDSKNACQHNGNDCDYISHSSLVKFDLMSTY